MGYEMAECHEASSDPLYPLQILDRPHVVNGVDLIRVRLNPLLGNDEAQKHAAWYPENAFFGVEPNSIRVESGKG